ncbi:conserved hypothetical protein [Alkaliphilus metalliredigens QYMF]|uniref:DUF4956 domain-containing protein n=1 Tax=Alkaliphilus metalliredigens (strain QYMF) TaxID=293826 RepID=A6TK22_ALKMQ|nr:DUF4956 domain-containing protein [Alkaliphilus metalliredigens]ABR46540.1 conserved hypothetical protein [Alkaliphilus metalliredigens QYMF]
MEQLFEEAIQLNGVTPMQMVINVIVTMIVSLCVGLIITYTYRKTHKGANYSQSFVHTLLIMNIVISVVIMVIGSNIARAFSLAGALSIVRFRSAIRDPKDVAFIFFAMAVGLATGTGNYLVAIVFAIVVSFVIYGLYTFNYGDRGQVNKILKITVPENLNYEGLFDDLFQEHLIDYSLASVKTTNLGTMFELTYFIRSKEEQQDKELIDGIRCRNANLRVAILLNAQDYYE